jgi:hypothetical protein
MSEVYLGVVATVKAFDKENGNEFVRVEQMIYFKNGARREVNPYGALHDPPENEYRRLKYIEVYWEELHRRAVDAFSSAREDYLSTAHANANCGFPAPDIQEAEDELAKLTQRVNLCKRKLKLTREKMLATPEGQRLIQQEADLAESHAENEEFIQTIRRFRI